MYYHGEFLNLRGETVTVRIVTRGSRAQELEIGAPGADISFADDPVEISTSVNGTDDHLLRGEATVRLLVRDFVPDFFCPSCRQAVVNILKGDTCVFAGFVEPQAYSQPYAEAWDELTLSCIDALSALQYSRYRNAGEPGTDYGDLRRQATLRSMESITTSILGGIRAGLDLSGNTPPKIWYDGSKGMTSTKSYTILRDILLNDLLFLGDEEDDVWTQLEVLEEMMRYLNLRVAMDGLDFRIFSWETVQETASIAWKDLIGGTTQTGTRKSLTFDNANATDTDTQVSVGETFNRILLTCDTKAAENLLESPLEGSAMTSPYPGRQLYMREYVVEGTGKKGQLTSGDKTAFEQLYGGGRTDNANAWTRDWYMRVMSHPCWTFRDARDGGDLYAKLCASGTNQQALPNLLSSQIGACLMAWGSVREDAVRKDDSIPGPMSMTNALMLSVNGNRALTASGTVLPTPAQLLAAAPVATYAGPVSGSVYSPTDDGTTHYIVFSGKIVMNPGRLVSCTATGETPRKLAQPGDNDKQLYYAQRFFKTATPYVHATPDATRTDGLQPFSDAFDPEVAYGSSESTGPDTLGKIPVVRCMLVIGDKCAVETGMSGLMSDFEWKPFKERSACASADEYYAQSFTLGFNPAVGDKLFGKEFPILNNIGYWQGLDVEGTAIPVRKSDALSGQVRFMVVGPVHVCWNFRTNVPELWDTTKTGSTYFPMLSMCSDIILSEFEVKIHSDNSGEDPLTDSDLIYMSDTDETYLNEKDDVTFRIVSALTAEERRELGVRDSLMLSTPCDASTGLGVTHIYDRTRSAYVKPEEAYVDALYTELHAPRVEMEHSVADTAANCGLFHLYTHPAMPTRRLFALGISRNLREASARLKLKETWI